jgi:hypothetical protein
MATRGVFSIIHFTSIAAEHGGSSRAIRDYIANGPFSQRGRLNARRSRSQTRNGQHLRTRRLQDGALSSPVRITNARKYVQEICDMIRRQVGERLPKLPLRAHGYAECARSVDTLLNLQEMPAFGVKMHESWVVVRVRVRD